MKFSEFPYVRLDLDKTRHQLDCILQDLEQAPDPEAFLQAFRDLDALKAHVSSVAELAAIRHTLDTRDPFYAAENDWYDEHLPLLEESFQKATDLIFASPYLDSLRQEVPETWFLGADMDRRSFSPEIVPDLQEEARLASAYQALVASAQIPFQGETKTLAELEEPMNASDPAVRREAAMAYWGWFADHEQELEDLYDRLVTVRTSMARKLGFATYTDLGYLRMHRFDYDRQDVETYRKQILTDIVPLCRKLYAAQAQRLGMDSLAVWNEKIEFPDGNPRPVCDLETMVQRAQEMYNALSEETGTFFRYMQDHGLLDLDARAGKAAGGYCTYLPDREAPFIFSNANGTQSDVETLTHEAGHAFQVWSSSPAFPQELAWPTSESAEIHSMSMEFFTWPWMESFFGDQADMYRFTHLSGAVKFLPYGILVDHFQHEVYDHPEWTPDERNACWRRLEKQYLPHKDYREFDLLERGGWWLRQLHIFMDPFYYVDYTLAQVAALQFLDRMLRQDPAAFTDYLGICRVGGTLPFRALVQKAGLQVPLEPGCLKQTAATLQDWFETHTPQSQKPE